MSKLKRFKENKNKKNTIKLIVAFLLVAVVSGAISYAVYQKEDEVLFINARVGQFETSSSDIELAMTLDGEDVDKPPSKGYYNVTVECDYADGEWDKEKWAAVIGNITSNRVKCNVNFETLNTRPLNIVEIGDYIKMTPTSTSYTPPSSVTGYTSTNNTLNPSELNLWRVIRKNEDGTVKIISENVSSTAVYFYGKTGYMNLIGGLNTMASQYTNEKYVSKTRYMGYSNQVEKCSGTLAFNNTTACPLDKGYETDINLVQTAVGTLVGKNSSGEASSYWIASRNTAGISGTNFNSRLVNTKGGVGEVYLYRVDSSGPSYDDAWQLCVRPILTLKYDTEIINGDGKSIDTAYQFE